MILIVELNEKTKYVINMDFVLEIRYHSSNERHSIEIFPNNGSQPWVWTFKDKNSLDKAYNDILFSKNNIVTIKDGLA